MNADLFSDFDAATVAAIRSTRVREVEQQGQARASKAAHRHHMRRCKSEAILAETLPLRIEAGDSWHVISHGDIDSLSYLRHLLKGAGHFDHVLLSTWCIARNDLEEIGAWIDQGLIEDFALYAGEIFPSQYGDEYEQVLKMVDDYGIRLIIARNHSKITLARNEAAGLHYVVESSANVNTNPRIEQSAIHHDADLFTFYAEFFDGIRSIDKRQ